MAHNIIAEKKHIVQSDSAAAEELFTGKSQSRSQSKPKFRTVILDESHYIKSEKTKRAIAARSKKIFIDIDDFFLRDPNRGALSRPNDSS